MDVCIIQTSMTYVVSVVCWYASSALSLHPSSSAVMTASIGLVKQLVRAHSSSARTSMDVNDGTLRCLQKEMATYRH